MQRSRVNVKLLLIGSALLLFAACISWPLFTQDHLRKSLLVVKFAELKGLDGYGSIIRAKKVSDSVGAERIIEVWKNCSSGIYLDVGSNVGVQIRKLYAPEKFKNANVLPIFDEYFGEDRSNVCSIGFEPNVAHTAYLKELNAHFERQRNQAIVLYEHAVSTHFGNATFYRDLDSNETSHEWGATLAVLSRDKIKKSKTRTTVQLVNLPAVFESLVLPIIAEEEERTGKALKILMKMDIEGAEYTVFPALALSGGLCRIDRIFLEWHSELHRLRIPGHIKMKRDEMLLAFENFKSTFPSCKVSISDLDDETYLDGTSIPF
jgi:hypothetical protein